VWSAWRAFLHSRASLVALFVCVAHALATVALFAVGLVPFAAGLDAHAWLTQHAPPLVHAYARIQSLSIVNSYGLFRVMTTDRLELTVEGAHAAAGPWRAYRLPFKPHRVDEAPVWVAPHQPRLDWQFWFASLGDYAQQPWMVHLCVRLLRNATFVVDALRLHDPFAAAGLPPPRLVRVRGAQWRFTGAEASGDAWWRIVPGTEREYVFGVVCLSFCVCCTCSAFSRSGSCRLMGVC